MDYVNAREIRLQARKALAQNNSYLRYVLALIVLSLLSGVAIVLAIGALVVSTTVFASDIPFHGSLSPDTFESLAFAQAVVDWLTALVADSVAFTGVMTAVLVIATLFTWFIGFAAWGQTALGIATVRGGMTFGHTFSGRGHGWKMGWVVCLKLLYVQLWSLLFLVPGIVKAFSYALTDYIAVDHPDWPANRCIDESRRLMVGNRWRLFCLFFSFLPWYILLAATALLRLGNLPALFFAPYLQTAVAAFYEDILDNDED